MCHWDKPPTAGVTMPAGRVKPLPRGFWTSFRDTHTLVRSVAAVCDHFQGGLPPLSFSFLPQHSRLAFLRGHFSIQKKHVPELPIGSWYILIGLALILIYRSTGQTSPRDFVFRRSQGRCRSIASMVAPEGVRRWRRNTKQGKLRWLLPKECGV